MSVSAAETSRLRVEEEFLVTTLAKADLPASAARLYQLPSSKTHPDGLQYRR